MSPRLAVPVVVAALLTGCSGDDPADPAAGPTAAPSSAAASGAAAPAMTTTSTIRRVTGRLDRASRDRLRAAVTATVDDWFEAAYLGGRYPRTDFRDAFEVFTRGARERAEQDRALMSNAAVGTTTYAVRPTARSLRIDALADGGRASAVTVEFRLGLLRSGETGPGKRERVGGHLYLTQQPGDGWRVFGYDVRRGAV